MIQGRRLINIALGLVLATSAVCSAPKIATASVVDTALEERLTETKLYQTSRKETLKSLAHLLYGHRSWWKKLRELNPKLAHYNATKKIRRGTEITYKAPEIGTEYVVQKNDWLVRIAIWKYGDTAAWKQVYERNVRAIAKPDLIHPGDHLYLEGSGSIQLARANKLDEPKETLVAGDEPPAQDQQPDSQVAAAQVQEQTRTQPAQGGPADVPAQAAQSQQQQAPLSVQPVSPQEQPQIAAGSMATAGDGQEEHTSFVPVLIGALALFLGMMMAIVVYTRRQQQPAHIAPRPDYFGTAKRPNQPGYELDKSLMTDEEYEVNQKPGYHSLTKRWKKYIQIVAATFKKRK